MSGTYTPWEERRTVAEEQAGDGHVTSLEVGQLTTPEHFIVWAVRYWVYSHRQNVDPLIVMTDGFARAGIEPRLVDFDTMMTITATVALRSLDVRCPKCRWVGDGERDILAAAALTQWHHLGLARERLETWLAPASARLTMPYLRDVMTAMRQRHLILPLHAGYLPADPASDFAPAEIACPSISVLVQ